MYCFLIYVMTLHQPVIDCRQQTEYDERMIMNDEMEAWEEVANHTVAVS
jgi:hypothetical protein